MSNSSMNKKKVLTKSISQNELSSNHLLHHNDVIKRHHSKSPRRKQSAEPNFYRSKFFLVGFFQSLTRMLTFLITSYVIYSPLTPWRNGAARISTFLAYYMFRVSSFLAYYISRVFSRQSGEEFPEMIGIRMRQICKQSWVARFLEILQKNMAYFCCCTRKMTEMLV